MRRSLPLALLVLAACGAAPTGPAPATPVAPARSPAGSAQVPALTGTYTVEHAIWMVCEEEDGCEEQVTDTLEVRRLETGALAISVELIQANAHTCTFEGELRPVPPTVEGTRAWRFVDSPSVDEDGQPVGEPCVVTLTATPASLELASEQCRDYCGVRAHLEATFPRVNVKR